MSQYNGFNIVLVGTGGTGTWFLRYFTKLLYTLQGKLKINFTIIDGDIVTESNLLRQDFIERDINTNKATTLAKRFNTFFGLKIGAIPAYIENTKSLINILKNKKWEKNIPILIGCVDNNATRVIFDKVFKELDDIIYIDSGNGTVTDDPEDNDKWTGQVVVGYKKEGQVILPPVGVVFSDILEDKTSHLPTELSCGEVHVLNPQLQLTNFRASDIISSYITNILTEKVIPNHYTTFNAQTNNTRPFEYKGKGFVKLDIA